VRGLNVLAATISTPLAAPVIAATRPRGGNAASARGAASLAAEAVRTAAPSIESPVGEDQRGAVVGQRQVRLLAKKWLPKPSALGYSDLDDRGPCGARPG
jgi:hypothetical protein